MNRNAQEILDALREFDKTPASIGIELRLSLAEILTKHLENKGWTQARLAQETSKKEAFISRVLHSNENCTLNTVGELIFPLGVRIEFKETKVEAVHAETEAFELRLHTTKDYASGKKIKTRRASTGTEVTTASYG